MSAGAKVRAAIGVVIDVHAHRRDADSIAVIERDRAEVRADERAATLRDARIVVCHYGDVEACDVFNSIACPPCRRIRALAAQAKAPAQAKGGG